MPAFRDKQGTARQSVLSTSIWILGGVASPCCGNFLLSWAGAPNYYLERFGEARLIDYIFPSLTGHLFSCVFYFFPH